MEWKGLFRELGFLFFSGKLPVPELPASLLYQLLHGLAQWTEMKFSVAFSRTRSSFKSGLFATLRILYCSMAQLLKFYLRFCVYILCLYSSIVIFSLYDFSLDSEFRLLLLLVMWIRQTCYSDTCTHGWIWYSSKVRARPCENCFCGCTHKEHKN